MNIMRQDINDYADENEIRTMVSKVFGKMDT